MRRTSASAAAYAARAGIKCVVLLPHGKIALGKLAQALMHGATTVAIEGNFDDALRIVRELGETGHVEVVNSINPVRIEGQKTAAFEVVDQLGQAPDFHFLPVGNAGNITAYWRGYNEYRDAGLAGAVPRMFGFQAANAAPLNSVPGTQTTQVDTALAFTDFRGSLISISDPDIGSNSVEVTLAGTDGSVTLINPDPGGALTYSAGDGTEDVTMTFSGTIAAVTDTVLFFNFSP